MHGGFLGQIRLGKGVKISSGLTQGDFGVSEIKGCTYILGMEPFHALASDKVLESMRHTQSRSPLSWEPSHAFVPGQFIL
jgi:hypothetical protein